MQVPLEIAFHNVDAAEWIEQEVRARAAKLDSRFPRLTGCQVRIEAPHKSQRSGNLFNVHIVLNLPGKDIVVTREPHHVKERYAAPDMKAMIRDAFEVAERQLDSAKQQRRNGRAAASRRSPQ
jgi:ribosome-associated translation inhibitor RaiA